MHFQCSSLRHQLHHVPAGMRDSAVWAAHALTTYLCFECHQQSSGVLSQYRCLLASRLPAR